MIPRMRIIQGDAEHLPLDCQAVDLVFGSPPYPEKGERYGAGSRKWPSREWATWMVTVTQEALRVCRGPVCWVVNGAVRGGRYLPAVERLVIALDDAGIVLERSCIWHKNAPPNRKNYFGNDWEPILVAKHPGSLPYWNWQAIGTPPKYKSGGRFRQRGPDGKRRSGGEYPQNPVTRPRDVFRVPVGGGLMGSRYAHENEASFPQALAEPFILSFCPPGGIVLDPFAGSGTTGAAALANGRNAILIDIRESQCELMRRRLGEIQLHLETENRSTGGVAPEFPAPTTAAPPDLISAPLPVRAIKETL